MTTVIFDLFETLITEWGHEKYTTRKKAGDLNIPYETLADLWSEMEHSMDMGTLTLDEAIKYVVHKLSLPITPELIDYIWQRRINTRSVCFTNIDNNVIAMLDGLKAQGYQFGLISNCSFEDAGMFRKSELFPYFDLCILSCEVGMTKPSAKIYDLFCKTAKVKPEDCLFVGDGGSHELQGASGFGMKTVQAVWFIKEYNNEYINKDGFSYASEPKEIFGYL